MCKRIKNEDGSFTSECEYDVNMEDMCDECFNHPQSVEVVEAKDFFNSRETIEDRYNSSKDYNDDCTFN